LGMLICRMEGVASSHTYALARMSPTVAAIVNSALFLWEPAER
jgi:hypothetical protein